jgi:Cu/Ag efflux protein CusF
MNKHLALFLLILVLAPFSWTQAGSQTQPSQQEPQLKPHGPGRVRKVDVARIEKQVRHELIMLPNLGVFDNLSFQVKNDATVVLLGQVRTATLKSEAENVTKSVKGVELVDNRITVLPPSPFDDRIRRATARAIFRHPAMTRYAIEPIPSIHIIVDRGHVTLEGVVDSEGDKNIAGIQASTVPDVFSVKNNLRVER